MKTALLHYWLIRMRGGEKVFAEIARLFPEADLFTHACNHALMDPVFGTHRITETFIGKLPFSRHFCQQYLPLMPMALKQLDLSGYDLIISSESGPAKGIRKPSGARHLCYCHTPMRYLWDLYDEYYRSASVPEKICMRLFRDPLRKYDRKSADGVDQFAANSAFVAERIRRIYHRDAVVIHPPADVQFFSALRVPKQDYYLLSGQLVSYKHPEIAVKACTRLHKRLVVTGTGPILRKLRKIAGPTVEFRGNVSAEELRRCYAEARALLFPGIEDFGIVPVEVQAAGTPVIAFGAGGVLETVLPGTTGLFFQTQDCNALSAALTEFERMSFPEECCRKQAERFSPEIFRKAFLDLVSSLLRV